MAEFVGLLDDSDVLVLLGAPGSGAGVGDWITYHAKSSSMEAMWMLRFERPQQYYDDLEDSDEPPEAIWADIEVDVDLLAAAPQAEPGAEYSRVAEVSVGEAAVLEGDDGLVPVTATDPGPYRVRLLMDESRFPTRLSVQSWPAPLAPGRVLRGKLEPSPEPPHPASLLPEVPAGVAAAARIGNDVDGGPGARTLSGEVGVVHARITLPRSPAWHGEWFARATVATANPDWSMPYYGQTRPEPGQPHDTWFTCVMLHEQQVDRITGWRGAIWSRPHPDDDPRRRRMHWWRWMHRIPPPPGSPGWTRTTMLGPVLPRDTLLLVHLNRVPGTPVHTEIVIEHRDVPVEWIDDLTDWWKLQLAIHSLPV